MDKKNSPKWIANLLIVLFLDWLFYFGWYITGRAFCDSDTCWLLAMGRWIIEHHSFPMVDPFSSGVATFATLSNAMPIVQYQWLAEISFYSVYHFAGLLGLILLISFISTLTFVCLPYLSLVKFNCHRAIVFVIILAITCMGRFSTFVRPQNFSYLFLALLIYMYIPTRANLKRIRMPVLGFTLLIMLVWTNMHIFFPLGIIFILMILGARLAETRIIDRDQEFALSQWVIPLLAVISTFVNPWGTGIWAYFYRIGDNINSDLITEFRPLQIFLWHDPMALSFWFLLIVYVALCAYYRAFKVSKLGFVSPLLFVIGLCLSLKYIKMMSVTCLLVFAACVELISRQANAKSPISIGLAAFWNEIDDHLGKQLSKRRIWLGIMFSAVMLGSVFAFSCRPVSLPQPWEFFAVPFKAIEYLKIHRPAGKVYNDPRFGSVMIWYLDNPDVFIDTRFSQYDPQRLPEATQMQNCDYGWKDIWWKYKFDWVFVRPSMPLVRALRQMDWKTVYEDKVAVILVKP